jgi:hypothetical protein
VFIKFKDVFHRSKYHSDNTIKSFYRIASWLEVVFLSQIFVVSILVLIAENLIKFSSHTDIRRQDNQYNDTEHEGLFCDT